MVRAEKKTETAPVVAAQESPAEVVTVPVKAPRKPRTPKAQVDVAQAATPEVASAEVVTAPAKAPRKPRTPKTAVVPATETTPAVVVPASDEKKSATVRHFSIVPESCPVTLSLLAGKRKEGVEIKTVYKGGNFKGKTPKQAATKIFNKLVKAHIVEHPDTSSETIELDFTMFEKKGQPIRCRGTSTLKETPVTIKRAEASYEVDRNSVVVILKETPAVATA